MAGAAGRRSTGKGAPGKAGGKPGPKTRASATPRLQHVLVPTDLSNVGDAAVPWAYALVGTGGTVHLLHVIEVGSVPNPLYAHYTPGRHPTPEERLAQERDLDARLRALAPSDAADRDIETRVEIVHEQGHDPAEAIRAAAERLGVDAICMGSHGRSGLSELVAGSIAHDVSAHSRCPVFLVRLPARED
jgi:nucleotide-binding universal stress UspA family protein